MQEGSLQKKSGPSIATEFGPLLPPAGGSGVGFAWENIVSQRWDWGTVHFNVEPQLTVDHHGEIFLSTILEGPHKWKVRPVAEFYFDKVFDGQQTFSALAGAIWQVNDKLSFDVALRQAWVDGRPVSEFRAGLTVGFSLSKPQSAQMPNQNLLGRR